MNNLTQTYSSKNTSVNTTQLPYIYTHLDWEAMKETYGQIMVFDYGCGKEVNHIIDFLTMHGIYYICYDPNYDHGAVSLKSYESFFKAIKIYEGFKQTPVILCSNVLNVITPWKLQEQIHRDIIQCGSYPFFFKIHEGNRSGCGGESKKDCWQWNRPTEDYILRCTEVIKKKILTHSLYAKFIK